MDDLVQWLRAQLDEDERIARAATPGPWWVDSTIHTEAINGNSGTTVIAGGRWGGEASVFESDDDAAHIVRHDPARVLREIDAKRAIITDLAETIEASENYKGPDYYEGVDACERTLKRLALPYADRPGYRDDWRP